MEEYPFILGTSGHIDHGKTTLVQALTGVDCDRLGEEKRRGITIELGFAPLVLSKGQVLSIIDVPGHERFIRQMVAGSAGIDAVMMVVAADEGVMPQTREHLDILKLLGITRGFTVLTKTDLVDSEMLALCADDVSALTEGTFLATAPIVPFSATSGEGREAVLAEIERIVKAVPIRKRAGAFFMPIDRAFSMKGFGSVVTGTLYHGSVAEGEVVEVMPAGLQSKVRSIQVHGARATHAVAGQRTAINLSSISLEQLRRGDVVCAKGRFAETDCIDAEVEALGSVADPISHWQRVRLHIGTTDVVARVSMLGRGPDGRERAIPPGGKGVLQLIPETPIVAAAGERFVIRFYSPLVTIGGGKVLLPYASRPKNKEERDDFEAIVSDLARNWGGAALLRAIVKERGLLTEQKLFDFSQMEKSNFERCLGDKIFTEIKTFGSVQKYYISAKAYASARGSVLNVLMAFHADHPELAGMGPDELHSTLAAHGTPVPDIRDFKDFMQVMIEDGSLRCAETRGGIRYRAADFEPQGGERLMSLVDKVRTHALQVGYELAVSSDMPALFRASQGEIVRVIGYLRENEEMKIIVDGLIFPKKTREDFLAALCAIEGDITIATVRDSIGTSRKYVLAMLEYFDSQGITKRIGDKRVLMKQRT